MASRLVEHDGYDEYVFSDETGDTYEHGDDETCPICGKQLDVYRDLSFADGVIQVLYHCCGKYLTFNYFLKNVVAED